MKKIFTKSWLKAACVAVLGLVSVNAWAQDVTIENANNTQSQDGVTISGGMSYYGAYWCGESLTVNAPDGYNFTRIRITDDSSWRITTLNSDVPSMVSNTRGSHTWEGSNDVVVFTPGSSENSWAPKKIECWLAVAADPSLTYSVNLSSVEHGTISASATTDVHAGDIITLSANPDAEYSLESWTVINNTTSGAVTVTGNTFKMPASDVTVSATFVKYHTVTVGSVSNGTVNASKTTNIKEGEIISLTATPNFGYLFDSWNVTNDETSASVSVVGNQFTMPDADVTVSALFAEMPKYTITIDNSIENGSVSASQTTDIYPGTVITLTPNPAEGYHLESLSVTNAATSASISVVNNQFTMPEANVNITASFAIFTDYYTSSLGTSAEWALLEVVDANSDGTTWQLDSYYGYAKYGYNTYNSADDYLIIPAIMATGGKYNVSVRIKTSSQYDEKFEIVYGTDRNALTNVLLETGSFRSSDWKTLSEDIVLPAGAYYFALHAVSAPDKYYMNVTNFSFAKVSEDITVSEAGYTTYYNSAKAYTLPAGLTGNVVYPTIEGGFALMPMYEAGDVVPADEPLVLEGAAGDYELVYTETTDPSLKSQYGNLLDGTDADAVTAVSYFLEDYGYTADDCYFFGLSLDATNDINSVGFYYMNATGAAFTNGAHKAYLCLPKEMLDGYADANSVRGFSFKDMENGISTGISNIQATEKAASFNLSGVRVANDAKGLVIRGGKKIFNK